VEKKAMITIQETTFARLHTIVLQQLAKCVSGQFGRIIVQHSCGNVSRFDVALEQDRRQLFRLHLSLSQTVLATM
jgi:hypothetical protein